jgi:outer membrane protein assembly factor BamE (lipoprotein component of BamABCDE complex)
MGHEINTADVAKLQPGKSTKDDVRAMLGEPTGVSIYVPNGETWIYSYSKASPKAANFIPIVGLFAGGADVKTQSVMMSFDMQGILKGFMDWPTLLRQGQQPAPPPVQPTAGKDMH